MVSLLKIENTVWISEEFLEWEQDTSLDVAMVSKSARKLAKDACWSFLRILQEKGQEIPTELFKSQAS